jgi:hypothetical protein
LTATSISSSAGFIQATTQIAERTYFCVFLPVKIGDGIPWFNYHGIKWAFGSIPYYRYYFTVRGRSATGKKED